MKFFLNCHSSRSVCINEGLSQGSLLGLALFLIYSNDVSGGISPQVSVCTHDTVIYSCPKSKPYHLYKVILVVDLENDHCVDSDKE